MKKLRNVFASRHFLVKNKEKRKFPDHFFAQHLTLLEHGNFNIQPSYISVAGRDDAARFNQLHMGLPKWPPWLWFHLRCLQGKAQGILKILIASPMRWICVQHGTLCIFSNMRVPVQRAVERDEIPYPWKSTTRRCVPLLNIMDSASHNPVASLSSNQWVAEQQSVGCINIQKHNYIANYISRFY